MPKLVKDYYESLRTLGDFAFAEYDPESAETYTNNPFGDSIVETVEQWEGVFTALRDYPRNKRFWSFSPYVMYGGLPLVLADTPLFVEMKSNTKVAEEDLLGKTHLDGFLAIIATDELPDRTGCGVVCASDESPTYYVTHGFGEDPMLDDEIRAITLKYTDLVDLEEDFYNNGFGRNPENTDVIALHYRIPAGSGYEYLVWFIDLAKAPKSGTEREVYIHHAMNAAAKAFLEEVDKVRALGESNSAVEMKAQGVKGIFCEETGREFYEFTTQKSYRINDLKK